MMGKQLFRKNDPRTRRLAKAGGRESARRARLRREGPTAEVREKLGALQSPADCKRWLEYAALWGASSRSLPVQRTR